MIATETDRVAAQPQPPKLFHFSWPLGLSLAVFSVVLVVLVAEVWKSCGGHFGYPMDDTYIHMAMARSFSEHGVWGLTRYAFSSSSSSPLFTLILAGVYAITGPVEIAPFALDVVFSFALLWCFDYVLRVAKVPPIPRAGLALLMVFGMPLGPETIAGMEHPLHALLTLLFAFGVARILTAPPADVPRVAPLLLLAALVVLARYEALALVAVTVLLFLWRRQWRLAMGLSAAAIAPIAAFGAYSVAQGWYPVPASIVAKVSRPGKGAWPYPLHWAEQLADLPSLVLLCVAALALWYVIDWRRRRDQRTSFPAFLLILFVSTLLLHMQFARIGWFFRYEAYLIVFGLVACGAPVCELPRRQIGWAFAGGIVAVGATLAPRAVESLWLTPYASRNIHEQQYQMARFLHQYFSGDTVLLSDIGAAGFLSGSRVIDLYGLSTIEVTRAKVHHAYTQQFRRDLAKTTGAQIAILYPAQYRDVGGLPAEWQPVGEWQIHENQICWGDTVVFYAVEGAARGKLIFALQSFRSELPADVTQRGAYLDGRLSAPSSNPVQ